MPALGGLKISDVGKISLWGAFRDEDLGPRMAD